MRVWNSPSRRDGLEIAAEIVYGAVEEFCCQEVLDFPDGKADAASRGRIEKTIAEELTDAGIRPFITERA